MSLIFLAYANNSLNPLPSLQKEDHQVYSTILKRSSYGHYRIHRDSNATLDSMIEGIQTLRQEIEIFSFSGHAGDAYLLTEGGEGGATGLAELLGECPNLKLIILNGCSTAGQVKRLIGLKNHPVVIATHATVEDTAASTFAFHFFRTLTEQYATIQEAYFSAMAAVRFKQGPQNEVTTTRAATGFGENESDESLWGIFAPEAYQYQLAWRLPVLGAYHKANNFVVNSILLDKLIEGLAAFNPLIEEIYHQEAEGTEVGILKKRRMILESLPHPISEHLRKLLVNKVDDSVQIFYDQLNIERLYQIYAAYKSIIEWPIFILLAQLWDYVISHKDEFQITDTQKRLIKSFLLSSSANRVRNFYFDLIATLNDIFTKNSVPLFVNEVHQLFSDRKEMESMQNAILFFERIPVNDNLSLDLINELCIVGEEKLAEIVVKFGFFTNYTLLSVKTIEVDKKRTQFQPVYRHQWIELIQRFVGLEAVQYTSKNIIDNASVHLRKGHHPNYEYLNLSPFIIDQNALKKSAQIAKLLYFERYDQALDSCLFKHAYKPNDNYVVVDNYTKGNRRKNMTNRILLITRQQMDAFIELLFDCKLVEL